MIKILVIANKNYRTDVFVNNKFAYQSGLHTIVERDNINRLLGLCGVENFEIREEAEVKR